MRQYLHVLGRYALCGEIAYGGMGSVHLGRLLGEAGFGRTVAIKRLHPQFAKDPEFVSMFLDEARLVARIRHPNVVPTLDVARVDGELFLVMEYVHGEPLAALLRAVDDRRAAAPESIIAPIVAGVLHGLHAAHEATSERGEALGIVHRDVSPQNILVGVDGGSRVLDFGIAKAVGRAHLTRDAQLKGKLAYMAPEQARGSATRLSDVFATGVVLWEALTLHRLFDADTDAEIMAKVLVAPVAPPSHYSPRVSPELDALTLRALSREPAERFQTAREMACALERCVAFAPMSLIGDWVEDLAHDSLAERTAKIAGIERSAFSSLSTSVPTLPASPRLEDVPSATIQVRTRALPAPVPAQPTGPSAPTRIAIDLPADGKRDQIAPTPFSAGSNTGHWAEPPSRAATGRTTVHGVALGFACALLTATALYAAFTKEVLPFPWATPIAKVASPRPTALGTAAPNASGAPSIPSLAPAPGAPAPVVLSNPSLPSTPLATMASTKSVAPAAAMRSRGARPHCNPPFVIDENGDRRYKRECYR